MIKHTHTPAGTPLRTLTTTIPPSRKGRVPLRSPGLAWIRRVRIGGWGWRAGLRAARGAGGGSGGLERPRRPKPEDGPQPPAPGASPGFPLPPAPRSPLPTPKTPLLLGFLRTRIGQHTHTHHFKIRKSPEKQHFSFPSSWIFFQNEPLRSLGNNLSEKTLCPFLKPQGSWGEGSFFVFVFKSRKTQRLWRGPATGLLRPPGSASAHSAHKATEAAPGPVVSLYVN